MREKGYGVPLFGVMAGALVALLVLFLWWDYQEETQQARIHTHNLTQVIASRLNAELEHIDGTLTHIDTTLLRSDLNGTKGSLVAEQLASLAQQSQAVSALFVFDQEGLLRYGSEPIKPFSIADRPHFQHLLNNPDERFTFSCLIATRSTDEDSIVRLRALRDADGQLIGTINAVIPIEPLTRHFNIQTGPGGVVLMRDSEAFKLIARVPTYQRRDFGQPLPPENPIRVQIESGEASGVLSYIATTDGQKRLGSFQVLEDHPFYVQVALSEAYYLAAWRQKALISALLVLLVIAALALLFYRLLKSEQDRSEQSALYQSLYQHVSDAIFIVRVEAPGQYRFIQTNRAHQEQTGIAPEAINGKTPQELLPDDMAAHVIDRYDQCLQEQGPIAYEERLSLPAGERTWMTLLTPLRASGGKITTLVGIARDITDQKTYEAQLESRVEAELARRMEAEEGREANEQLLARESQLRKEFDKLAWNLPGFIYQFRQDADGNGSFPYASRGSEEIYGCPPQALREDATAAFRVIEPADLDRVADSIAQSARDLTPWHCEYRVNHPQKGLIWIEGNSTPRRDESGATYWYGHLSEITERKKAEAEIRDLGSRLEATLAAIPDLILELDESGRFVRYSGGQASTLYRSPKEFIGQPVEAVLPPDIARLAHRAIAEAKTEGISSGHRYSLDLPEGRRHFELTMVRKENMEGPLEFVAIAHDVTEREQSEQQLRAFGEKLAEQVEHEVALRMQSEAKYRVLFNAVPDAIFVHEAAEDGTPQNFSEINDAGCALLGLPREEALKLNPYDLDRANTPETIRAQIIQAQKRGQIELEDVITTSDGQERYILTMLRSIRIADRTVIVAVFHDLTELKRLQDERQRQQAVLIQQSKLAELGHMIGAIAHQWKQPINAIALIAQGLPDAYAFDELDQALLDDSVDRIMKQVLFMSKTVDDFRNFYKPSRTQERFDPLEASREVVDLLKAQLMKHQIAITLEGSQGLIVSGYASAFKQVILNLINNAKDALQQRATEQPLITITVQAHSDQVRLRLCDNGGGIPEELLPDRLFDAFTSTKGEEGTGIGLSLARTIIEEKMGGSLKAYNQKEGACFEIVLSRETKEEE